MNYGFTDIQDALDYVVRELYEEPKPGLSNQDIFYREVTKIHRGLWALVEKCVQASTTNTDPVQLIALISETNNILLVILQSFYRFFIKMYY